MLKHIASFLIAIKKKIAQQAAPATRLVTEELKEASKRRLLIDNPRTLEQLWLEKVQPGQALKLEYFFYTDDRDNAADLTAELQKLNYTAKYEFSGPDTPRYLITGWTTPIPILIDTVNAWTFRMADLGYEYDCDFDGWGTYPTQP